MDLTVNLENKNCLIIGAGHGIGLALVKNLLSKNINTYATYRDKEAASELLALKSSHLYIYETNPTSEDDIIKLSRDINVQLELIINSVGMLHTENISPEKTIKHFDVDTFLRVMKVNACVTPLIAKHFFSHLPKNKTSVLASLSAKIGSIEDNRVGGWHSYRASKAALNMLIKNIGIELERKKVPCHTLALHPGTTKTELSRPFINNTPYKLHTPDETAQNLLKIIENLPKEITTRFYAWDGALLPW